MLLSRLKSVGGKMNTPLQFKTAVKSKKVDPLKRTLHVEEVKDPKANDSESIEKKKTKRNVAKDKKTVSTNGAPQMQDDDENVADDMTDKQIKKPKKAAVKRKLASEKAPDTPEGKGYTPQMLAITEKLKSKKVVKRGKRAEKRASDKENNSESPTNYNAEMERIRDKMKETEPEVMEEAQVESLAGTSNLGPSKRATKKTKLKQESKFEGRVLRGKK